jgi:hypothetical protein
MPYERTTVDLGNFITALRQADLVDLKWGDRGMLCGNPLPAGPQAAPGRGCAPENPKVLTLIVADEADAWIINRAKEAISQGDEETAYAILAEITQTAGEHRAQH